jgi:hypothetical protein
VRGLTFAPLWQEAVLRRVAAFAGVLHLLKPGAKEVLAKGFHVASKTKGKIPPALEAKLQKFFAPFNADLVALLAEHNISSHLPSIRAEHPI